MSRREFPGKIRVAAWKRADGRCEECTRRLYPGDARFDHRVPLGLTGEPTLENAQHLCRWCHDRKTFGEDMPAIARAKRRERAHLGIKRTKSRPMLGNKNSDWKHKVSGGWVRR
jgi:5-methylcytosine-specific restriction endonuclease McrA